MYIVAHNVNFYTGGGGFSSGATAGPFGQTFGKTTTTGFTTPAFGSAGSSLFGSSTPTTGGLFGGATATPVFGQAQTTQPSAFGTVLKLGSYVIPALCSTEEDLITFPVLIFFFFYNTNGQKMFNKSTKMLLCNCQATAVLYLLCY